MKITDEIIDAAFDAISGTVLDKHSLNVAIETALRVRKARKAEKREAKGPDVVDFGGAERPNWPNKSKSKPDNYYKNLTIAASKDYTKSIGDGITDNAEAIQLMIDSPLGGIMSVKTPLWERINNAPTPNPTWDGKFEVGKSYRTRDGRQFDVVYVGKSTLLGDVNGFEESRWIDGRNSDEMGVSSTADLVSPWEQP